VHVSLLCALRKVLKRRVTTSHVDTLKYGDNPSASACRIVLGGERAEGCSCELKGL